MSDADKRDDLLQDAEYEPPRAEDVETDDAPSVSAAGKTQTPGAG